MQCNRCGGHAVWVGPLTNLTHIECQQCGTRNDVVEMHREAIECDTCQGEGTIDQGLGGFPQGDRYVECPDCDGEGEIYA